MQCVPYPLAVAQNSAKELCPVPSGRREGCHNAGIIGVEIGRSKWAGSSGIPHTDEMLAQ